MRQVAAAGLPVPPVGILGVNIMIAENTGLDFAYRYQIMSSTESIAASDIMMSLRVNF
jgi:hypothetical protein